MKHPKILAVPALSLALLLSACGSPAAPSVENSPAPSVSVSASPAGTSPAGTETTPAPATSAVTTPVAAGTALALLDTLESKPQDTASNYDRELFGDPWEDIDGNGCDTRNDMLLRDLKDITVAADECKVLLGTLLDPYSGKIVNFDQKKGGGGGIDIDHVVALSAGFKTGGASWDSEKKLQFANDPLNLISSASGPNRAKGDKDASEWLPATAGNPAFNCIYVARQVAVKAKYTLWVTPAEEDAMRNVLTGCPNEPVPTDKSVLIDQDVPVSNGNATAPEAPAPAPVVPAPAPANGSGVDPDYGSCTKAKAAGAGPYTAADPEYKFYRDGDGDGTVCE